MAAPESTHIAPNDLAKLFRDDIERYDIVVRHYLEQLYRLLTLVIPLIGLAITALYRYEEYLLLLLMPFLTSLSILVAGSLTVEMYALAAHKYFLEESLSKLLRSTLPLELQPLSTIPWDDVGGSLVRRARANWSLWRLFPIMVVGGGSLSIAAAWVNLGHRWYLAAASVPPSIGLYAVSLWSLAKAPGIYHSTLEELNGLRHSEQWTRKKRSSRLFNAGAGGRGIC